MQKTFNKQTVEAVRGNVGGVFSRTPLTVAFGGRYAPAAELDPQHLTSRTLFNAIGSRCVGMGSHLPVLDVDGGVRLSKYGNVSKAIIGAAYKGRYTPESHLRDVLGDHGIELEVFSYPDLQYSRLGYDSVVQKVATLVLRTQSPIFDAVASTHEDHSHLYINTSFSDGDHTLLIDELAKVGVVSENWQKIAQQEGMGIVRTPWTEKAPYLYGS